MPTCIEITAYSFTELAPAAQEKARSWFREGIDSSDAIREHYRYTLGELGYPTDTICFSLGYCQGDGMAFYGQVELEEFFTKRLTCAESVPEFRLSDNNVLASLRDRIGKDIDAFSCSIGRNTCGWRYSHFNTMSVSVDFDTGQEDAWRLELLADELEQWLDRDVRAVSKLLEQAGYDIIEGDRADEQVDEGICANEYLFTASGGRSYTL